MTNPQIDHRKRRRSTPPADERLFRLAVILLVLIGLLVLIVLGAYVGLKLLGEGYFMPDLLPGSGQTEMPQFDATATAACEMFMQQFLGTPCPSQ